MQEDFFIKENGKKMKLSLNLNFLPTDQLFEVPDGMFKITGVDEVKPKAKSAKKEAPKPPKTPKIKEVKFTEAEINFLAKLKRRIFFVSATLTREFKGTKYFIKKSRTEDEWKQKREERKQKRKEK